MKRHLLTFLYCVISAISAQAHSAASYAFTQSSGTYADLTSPTSIYAFSSNWDDNVSSGWNIGFTFNYCGTGYTTFNICANGWITFSTIGTNTYTPLSVKTNAVSIMGGDLFRSTAGFVSYQTTGTAPNRVCTIQWKDVCHFNSSATGPLNFQIRLYETSNVIEFIYGTCAPTSTSAFTYHIGVNGASTADFNNRSTTTNWAATVAGTGNTATCTRSNTISPSSGLILRWTPPCVMSAMSGSDVCVGATATYSHATAGGSWTSSNSGIATVNSSRVVTGVSAGTANITYTVGTCISTRTIKVNPLPVATAIASPSVICAGGSSGLNVTSTNPGAAYGLSAATFSPVSFTATGTLSGATTPTVGTNDDGYYTVSMPFTFNFYGNNYTSCNIGTNGYVMFGGGVTSTYINAIPNVAFPATLSLFGRDMDLRTTGSITYGTTGSSPNRRFIISYNAVPDFGTGLPETGQIIIYETSGDVEYHVTTAQATRHTVGIQNATGTSNLPVPGQNNATTAITNTAYKFSMPMPSVAWATSPTLSSLTIANPTTSALSATTTYTVTATASNGCKGSTTVTVNVSPTPAALTGITTLCQTGTTTLTSTAGGTWASSNTGIATVATGSSSTGIVTGISAGSATISYFFGASCYVTQSVTVLPTAPVTGPTSVCSGLTITLTNSISGGTWTSSNTGLATVNPSTGVVTGVAAGRPNIIYTLPTTCARFLTITVNPLPAPFIGTTTVCRGLSTILTESTTGGVWSSGSTAIATVGSVSATTGVVTGISPGTTIITYTLPTSCIMTASVLVNPLPVPITAPRGACVTDILNPKITLVNGTPLGTWSSSNTSVASIISFSGQLTGLVPGTTTITYTLPTGCIATTPIAINPLPLPIAGTKVVCANATAYLSNPDIGGVWSSGDISSAIIDAGSGIVTGIAGLSTPTISYTLPTGCLGITTITVNPAPGAFSGSAAVCEGSTTVLAVGGGGTWQSTNPAIASVTPGPAGGGVISGIAVGNTDITYTLPGTGCYSMATITVNTTPAAITGVTSVCYGATTTLNDATPGGRWSSSDNMIAFVSGGMVVPVAAAGGTVAISYVLPTGCNAVRQVTVNPLPIVYNLNQPSGLTSYCSGDGGLNLQLNASVVGVNYQLYNNGVAAGIANGNGGVLSFGRQVDAGSYTAVAIDGLTGCQSNMTGSPVISIDPLPTIYALDVAGSSRYCDIPGGGVDVILSHSDPGVEYTLFIDGTPGAAAYGTGSILSFGLQTTEGIYTATATDPVTRCTSNMSGSILVGKNPLPAVHSVITSDGGNYCAGTAGVHVGLDYGNRGIRYDLYDGATLVTSAAGANSALDFGVWPAGNYTVVGVNAITGCSNNMSGTAMVTTLPLPTLHNVQVIGSSSYCIGSPGAHVQLSGSDRGIGYQLYDGGALIGDAVPGTAAVLDYGFLPTGNYTIVATDSLSGCSVNMSGSAVITTFPTLGIYNASVEAPGSYCAGDAGLHIYLSGSAIGVKYDLRNGGAIVATRPTGTGAALDFGAQHAAGAYFVTATDVNGCSAAMMGTPTIVINTLPSTHDVTNGGTYCAGSAGVNIGLNFSDAGISYQLYNGATPVGGLVTGSNSALDFGAFTTTGTYTVKAVNTTSGCLQTMNGSAVVKMNASPVAYNISGGGSYCAGSVVGVPVGLINSTVGVDYQLFNGTSTGPIVSGTGGAISFGNQIATGNYTIVGTDAVSGCTTTMTGSKVISIDPLPIAYTVTGGGTNGAGGTGFKVALSNSTPGIDYQLWNGSSLVATKPGTGSAIDYGIQTAAGTYTVFAKTVISGCSQDMSGAATISYNPLPAVHAVAGTGTYCDGGAGAEVYMATSQAGINYQLYKGTVAVGSPVLGNGAKVSFGNMPAGTYTAIAYDAATGCSMNMSGAATISKNALPAAYTVTGGGTMCAGGTGFHIYLAGSQIGVNYQLYEGGIAKGGTMPGTGSAIDFGVLTAGATYTAIATNTMTGCVNNMAGSGKIVVNAAPVAFAVTGGGNYCESGTGVAVGLEGSVPGMNYQLYNSATAVGMPVGGTGSVITFGLQKGAGTYTVMATNTASKCTATMTGSVAVVIDPMVVPAVTVGGTDGKACIGDVVNYTASAVNGGTAPTYLWKVGGLPKATGASFSTIPVIGDVIAVEMTGNAYCASAPTATTSVAMEMIPYVMPTATVSVNPGVAVCTGTPVSMSATTTDGGTAPGYGWMKNGEFVGTTTNYDYTATKDGDVFVFMLRSNSRCRMSDTVFSDPVVMDIDVAEMPDFKIKSHKNETGIYVGSVDSFTVEFTAGKKPKGTLTYQWYVMGAMVPGATLPVFIDHNIYDNNIVSCEVRRVGACGNQSATRETTVHLKNLGTKHVVTMASDVSILPNPNKGEFTVKGTIGIAEDEAVTLEITNMLGQVVYTNKVMTQNSSINERISLSNTLANGMYLLNIRTSAGNNVFHVVIGQ